MTASDKIANVWMVDVNLPANIGDELSRIIKCKHELLTAETII